MHLSAGRGQSGNQSVRLRIRELTLHGSLKNVSLNYCKNLLRNKDPKVAFANHVKHVEMLHEIRMVEPIEDDLEVMPLEAFNKAVEAIKKKQGKYDFFKKAGKTLYPAL